MPGRMGVDLAAWLRDLGLERYAAAFLDAEITAEALPELTDADLRELGLPLGPRKVLLKAVRALAGLLPPPVGLKEEAALWRAPTGSSQAERRQLTVMFVDLVGSTELAGRLDPEDMREVIRAYQNAVAGEVTRFEGHVAKFMGDGVLAYFGWPRAHEDDAERAVRAGLAVAAAVPGIAAPAGERLAARVGIATGPVVVGDLVGEGEAQRARRWSARRPNLAARLQALAEPGAVVVAEGTRRLLGGLFALRDLGAVHLKGFAAPVRAFAVAGEGAAEGRFEARHAAGRLTPLVGREQELALLLDRWERAKEGEGQVVLLSGEAGIGKSRLVRALRERLGGEPHTALAQFCSPHHTHTALHPVIGLLEREAGLRRDEPPERRREKLAAALARAAIPDVAESRTLLADLLGIPAGDRDPPLGAEPAAEEGAHLPGAAGPARRAGRQRSRCWRSTRTCTGPTRPRSSCWAGWSSGRSACRCWRVITFRPEFAPPWAGHGHVTALSLSRLARRQGGAMVERVTGGRTLPAEVLEQILARTDGVPLFVEELTKAVLEIGPARRAGATATSWRGRCRRWRSPRRCRTRSWPGSTGWPRPRRWRRSRRCIGREFDHDLLAAVGGMPDGALEPRSTSWWRRSWSSAAARRPPARRTLQARAGAGCRVPEPAEEPAAGAARAHRGGPGGALPRGGRRSAGAAGVPPRGGRPGRARDRLPAAGVAPGARALRRGSRPSGTCGRRWPSSTAWPRTGGAGRWSSSCRRRWDGRSRPCAASRRPRPIAPSRGRRRSASGCRSAPGCSRCCGAVSSPSASPAIWRPAIGRRGSSCGSRDDAATPATS